MTGRHRAKAESDVESDPKVAGSRADLDGNDGSYLGRASADDDFDSGATGAEVHSQEARSQE
jgi:hypothetical protein